MVLNITILLQLLFRGTAKLKNVKEEAVQLFCLSLTGRANI